LARKQSQRNRGKSPNRGKGTTREKFQKSRGEAGGFNSQTDRGGSSRGGYSRGRNPFPRGRGRGRGGEVKCYACGKTGHMSWECPENKNAGVREAHISEAQQRNVETEMKEEAVEEGRSLMMRKSLVKPKKRYENQSRETIYSELLARPKTEYAR
jgi:hypothetical protein